MKWDEYFYYDETSPSCLRWKIKPPHAHRVAVGNCVGNIHQGRWKVQLRGKKYLVHRIIYEMHYGEVPNGNIVDHFDRNGLNNRITNLRAVKHSVNMRNQSKRVDNRTGVTGVLFIESFIKHGKRYPCPGFIASWYDLEGKRKSKFFSLKKHGDQSFQLACEYRAKMIAELNAQGAGYTETHGL